jgi:murein L,D-transpeptidase YafK
LRPNQIRTALISAAFLGAALLGGCNSEGTFQPYAMKAQAPIPPRLLADIADKNMDVGSPMLVRVFKSESELEVWKQDRTGRYALLKTYPICKWSGDLGPKVQEGDRQAPEGFYDITPAQMNPNSQFYLAFNMGYPNAYDRAHDRTGAHLMVHGDCSSRGCYAMSDEQIQEIFALGRESFFGGQKSFQVQAYPFRMTPANMAKHRNNPNIAFWRMLKEGNDHFEVTRLEPKVDVCEKRYVFNAAPAAGNFTPMAFSPKGRCPAYEIPQEVASAVYDKKRSDDLQIATLASRGVPTAPIKSGRDGGMHPTFVAKLRPQQIVDERGNVKLVVDKNNPSPVVAYSAAVQPEAELTTSVVSVNVPLPRSAPQAKVGTRPADEPSFGERLASFFRGGSTSSAQSEQRVAAAEPVAPKAAPKREGVRAKVSRMIGLRGSNEQAQAADAPAPAAVPARPASPKVKTAAASGEAQPQQPAAAPAPAAPSNGGVMSGSQPIPPSSNNFDSRWSAFR